MSSDNQTHLATVEDAALQMGLRLLRATVVEPWESVDQLIKDHGHRELGDPLTEGTGAWHLRHIVEIFRLHARTVAEGLCGDAACMGIAPPDAPIPLAGNWSPTAARNELLADLDRFCTWLTTVPPDARARRFTYGSQTDLPRMLSTMLQHITWHAAAVHYWVKWKSSPGT
jgi:hypothetical protein